jgi:hypothetical protein
MVKRCAEGEEEEKEEDEEEKKKTKVMTKGDEMR